MSILSVPLRLIGVSGKLSPRQRQWDTVLSAALSVPRYRAIRARLEWARQHSISTLDHDFAEPVSLRDFFENIDQFRHPGGAGPVPAPLAAPWPGARNAQSVLALRPWFPLEDSVAILQRTSLAEVELRKPDLLVGDTPALCDLASAICGRRAPIDSLRWGVIAWSCPGRPLLSQAERELLWQAFQVPVWEQFRGFHGELLAEQCEASDGLHLRDDDAIWESPAVSGPFRFTSLRNCRHPVFRLESGIDGSAVAGLCDCGQRGIRAVPSTDGW
jgi:hypothetical protein